MKLLGLLVLLLGLFGCQKSYYHSETPMRTVSDVDFERYQGLWYEIARYPHRGQKDCLQSTALYLYEEQENRLKIRNECSRQNGETRNIQGYAYAPNPETPGKLRVRFDRFPLNLFSSNYWITDLDPDYEYAVVSEPRGRYLWILSRRPQMDELVLQDILDRLEKRGFDLDHLVFSPETQIYSFRKTE